ncbi:MAG: hypothetical protein WDA27_05620 [Actinomycetota bacterium]
MPKDLSPRIQFTEFAYKGWRIKLTFDQVGSSMECVGVEIMGYAFGADPRARQSKVLTATALRSIPLAKLIKERRGRVVGLFRAGLDNEDADWRARTEGELERWESTRSVGRPPEYGADHWRKVAQTYREAFRRGDHPTKAVAARFHLSHSAATKHVARTRALGLLGPTKKGKAGGLEPPRKRKSKP